ncbi:Gfo/Idh/MocA family oxidoreductase [Terrarubrum flagellatum]|uniref:Gfo/Idh/MocA family protein n=1 Tax=Terrirubrum flagellatum TaxID=2895980 RepID=UPI003144F1DF
MRLRAVLVGCGNMSRRWLDAALKVGGIEVVGLVDVDLARARALAEERRLSDAATGDDLDAMLAMAKPDVVFDTVVPEARFNVTLTALRHGCHVLSEKPMADTIDHARDLVRAAREAKRLHVIVQNRRYIEGVRRLRSFVESGAIGAVTGVHTDFFLAPHFGGFREEMRNVLLIDMAIHTFDAVRYVINGAPLAVYCHEANPAGSWYAHGASAFAIFEFERGVTYTYRGSWCAQGLRTSWESSWRITGEKGTLTWDGHDAFHAEREGATGVGVLRDGAPLPIPSAPETMRIGGHEGVLRDFVEALETGVAPETVSSENFKSLAMTFAAIESARLKRRVPVPTLASENAPNSNALATAEM